MTLIDSLTICMPPHPFHVLHVWPQLQNAMAVVPEEKADVRPSPFFTAAAMISQGNRDPVDKYRRNHGGVQIWIEAEEFGPYMTWYKLVRILQGMADFASLEGFWSQMINVLEDGLGVIARITFYEKRT